MNKVERFRDPHSGVEESARLAWLWTLLFGFIYFAVKGIWTHAAAGIGLALLTFGLSWFIYPFFARRIVERHYQKQGWEPVSEARPHFGVRQCPYCFERIRGEARVCRHCGSAVEPMSAMPARAAAVETPSQKKLKSKQSWRELALDIVYLAVGGSIVASAYGATWFFYGQAVSASLVVTLASLAIGLVIFGTIIAIRRQVTHRSAGLLGVAMMLCWILIVAGVASAGVKYFREESGSESISKK